MTTYGKIRSAAGTQSKDQFTDSLLASLPPIYEKESKDSMLSKLYASLAEELVRADIKIESVAHNNYLSVPITDEVVIRGANNSDRLQNENAFELTEIRLTPPGTVVTQNTLLVKGINQVQLFFIPSSDIDIIIFDTNDPSQTALNFPTSFDLDSNILTVIATRGGAFRISYRDTGNVVRLNENITVPEGLFRLGWNEGGFSELGWGE